MKGHKPAGDEFGATGRADFAGSFVLSADDALHRDRSCFTATDSQRSDVVLQVCASSA
jgi:hypothetical protein